MRTGKSLTQLAQEITRINEAKRDFVVPVARMRMNDEGRVILANGKGEESFGLTTWADQQAASYLDIPKGYYDRLRAENPRLLAANFNHGLSKNQGDKRMLRTLDGNVRALVSDRFRRLESYDLLQTVLPIMLERSMDVVSAEITERRLYVRTLMPKLTAEIKVGDPVQYGLQISSSDVGAGALRVEPLIFRLVCLNGLITEHAIKKYHVGRAVEVDDTFELLSDETKELDEAAFWARLRDVVLGSLRPEIFAAQVDRLRDAADRQIKNFNLQEVVELTCKTIGFSASKDVKQGILEALASGNQGAGLTQWGLANSFTAVAAHNDDIGFDDVVELEKVGGKIIELKPDQWKKIAG